MINNKGNVSIIAINIIVLLLFYTMLINSIFIISIEYYNKIKDNENLFLIENAVIMNIYHDYKNVNFNNNKITYYSKVKEIDGNHHLDITLIINHKIYYYLAVYDNVCNQVLSFNEVDLSNSI
ncbi:MAG: hypothetical protein LBR40_05630 [Bacilli bacterium]|jgi:hypothetical protein|nr:hypothetical protein [Bacilli bacterium]